MRLFFDQRVFGIADLLLAEVHVAETGVKPRKSTAAVEQLSRATRPRRMGLGVNVEVHCVTLLAPGRAGEILGAVRHHDLDRVIIGVNVLFHDREPFWRKRNNARDASPAAGGSLETDIFSANSL